MTHPRPYSVHWGGTILGYFKTRREAKNFLCFLNDLTPSAYPLVEVSPGRWELEGIWGSDLGHVEVDE